MLGALVEQRTRRAAVGRRDPHVHPTGCVTHKRQSGTVGCEARLSHADPVATGDDRGPRAIELVHHDA
jgi:hypothetical protein